MYVNREREREAHVVWCLCGVDERVENLWERTETRSAGLEVQREEKEKSDSPAAQ